MTLSVKMCMISLIKTFTLTIRGRELMNSKAIPIIGAITVFKLTVGPLKAKLIIHFVDCGSLKSKIHYLSRCTANAHAF